MKHLKQNSKSFSSIYARTSTIISFKNSMNHSQVTCTVLTAIPTDVNNNLYYKLRNYNPRRVNQILLELNHPIFHLQFQGIYSNVIQYSIAAQINRSIIVLFFSNSYIYTCVFRNQYQFFVTTPV